MFYFASQGYNWAGLDTFAEKALRSISDYQTIEKALEHFDLYRLYLLSVDSEGKVIDRPFINV